MENHQLFSDIQTTQSQFYESQGGKNRVFKKTQKFGCAETVCANIPLDALMQKTFWTALNENHIYFEYPLFKLYAHPGNFTQIVDKVIELCAECRTIYGTISLHVNFEGFTISAAERYKSIVSMFSYVCEQRGTGFTPHIEGLYLYNVLSSIETITAILLPLIPPDMRSKIHLVNR